MKGPYTRACLLALGLPLAACSAADEPSDGEETTTEWAPPEETPAGTATFEELRDRSAVEIDGETFYNVEWDMYFSSEEDLRAYYDASIAESEKSVVITQPSTGLDITWVRNVTALNIRYCVSTNFANQAQAITEMAAATRAWEQVANVRFVYLPGENGNCTGGNPAVDVSVFSTGAIAGACATPPYLQPSALPIWCPFALGTLAMNYGAFAAGTTTGVLRHELGHILGLRHEHPWAPGGGGCGEQQTYAAQDLGGRQLTAYDQNSVMHYPQCAGNPSSTFEITFLDGVGVRSLYGVPAAWYTMLLGPT